MPESTHTHDCVSRWNGPAPPHGELSSYGPAHSRHSARAITRVPRRPKRPLRLRYRKPTHQSVGRRPLEMAIGNTHARGAGFVHDICSAIHPLGRRLAVIRSVDLDKHGHLGNGRHEAMRGPLGNAQRLLALTDDAGAGAHTRGVTNEEKGMEAGERTRPDESRRPSEMRAEARGSGVVRRGLMARSGLGQTRKGGGGIALGSQKHAWSPALQVGARHKRGGNARKKGAQKRAKWWQACKINRATQSACAAVSHALGIRSKIRKIPLWVEG